jgi:hypothetical protein
MGRDIVHLVDVFVRGESHVELLDKFLRRHFLSNTPKGRTPNPGGERVLSKRAKRREDYAKVQNLFHKNRSKCAQMVLDGEKSSVIEDEDMFVKYWADMMTKPPPSPLRAREVQLKRNLEILVRPVSLEEVTAALRGPAKAVGPDGVDLKKLRGTPLAITCCLLNLIYVSPVPETLRAARVAFVPKIAEATQPGHFRPIAVGSYLQRSLNKILAKRMQSTLDILAMQRAFLPYDGTFENLNIIDSVIRDARGRRRELRLASLDLRKAFDMVSHDAIVSALASRGYPMHFTEYVKNLYSQSTTKLRCGASTMSINPTRGVRQGDPLSPLLFNLVLDDVFQTLDAERIGYQAGESRILGVAYADDVILTASSKVTLQRILDLSGPMLEERGLSINTDKSFSVSIVPAGKVKKVKVIDIPEFKIGTEVLPCMKAGARWKYLGVHLDDRGRLPIDANNLDKYLDRISAAPLKPAQRLVILKDYLIPRLMHGMVCGEPPSAATLRKCDQRIRNVVKRKWLHLEDSVPTGYLYAKIAQGGLGLPCLLTLIPRTALSRMTKLTKSKSDVVKWAASSESFTKALDKTRKLCKALHCTIETSQQENEYWAKRLHSTFDGAHLRAAEKVPDVHRWVLGMPFLSGREYINLVKCRINALPTRARLARGRREYNRQCRYGCDQAESLNHITQTCPTTHRATIKRHDDVCKFVTKRLIRKGLEVQREKLYREPGRPGLKPDIIVITNDRIHVLDVEICGTSRDMDRARQDKIGKYRVAWLSRLLPHPERHRVYGSITLSSTGIWQRESAADLTQLGFTKSMLVDLTVSVVQGSLRIFRMFQSSKPFIARR